MEQEEENESVDVKLTEIKPVRLSLHLIQKRHINDAQHKSQEEIVQALNKITHLRLDRENIGQIDNLELLGDKVTNVYLQKNKIQVLQNLECLKNLTFLTLADNQISQVEGLSHLHKLLFLDLSHNHIHDFQIDEFPESVMILNLKENPCTKLPDYRGRLVQDLENLQLLDEEKVTTTEKREAGFVVSSDEEEEEEEETGVFVPSFTDGDSISTHTSRMLMHSKERADEDLRTHLEHTSELDNYREKFDLPMSSRSQTPSVNK
ncbi:leucine-rich repeat-containing protein 46-like [Pecten maximus]|uniref:leucine-rich repeat-containing protein 46-like n=1 Tax=Pecten maximus TaxID=6579 RepID=UPI0014589893|nr:leucine-rich repeat-containing protein 46-like [Pecten maximus]XP_033762362.1 leucine-rich repeat-containing protein 46-like [Pecten maximus]XP_033762363.1 leucine-rich repeat-containing protein 46-like [Pecten maximus]